MSKPTAVLMSGHARTLKRCLPNQAWFAYRKLTNPHFFLSLVDDENAVAADAMESLYPGRVHIEKIKQPDLPEISFQNCAHAPYAVTPTGEPGVGAVQGFLRLFWHLNRVWDFFGEKANRDDFDLVMWSRGDLHFHVFDLPEKAIGPNDAYLPWWGLYGGVNTSGGLFGMKAAESYCRTHGKINALMELGCPLHCESIFEASMLQDGVKIHKTLAADFAWMRPADAKTGRPEGPQHMIVQPQEMCRYAAALSRTHLATIENATFQPAPTGMSHV